MTGWDTASPSRNAVEAFSFLGLVVTAASRGDPHPLQRVRTEFQPELIADRWFDGKLAAACTQAANLAANPADLLYGKVVLAAAPAGLPQRGAPIIEVVNRHLVVERRAAVPRADAEKTVGPVV
jgi:hypothetical protein